MRPEEPDGAMRSREHRYLVLMGTCIGLIVLAWFVIRLWSVPAAIVLSCVAALIPPVAVIMANRPDNPGE